MKSLKMLVLFLAIAITSIGLSACGGNSQKPTEKPAAQSQSNTDTNEKDEKDEKDEKPAEDTAKNNTEEVAEKLKQVLSIGYAGTDNHNSTIYWAVSPDVDFGVLLVVSADESQRVSFVGEIISNGSELTITDEKTGNSRTVDVKEITHEGKKGIQLTDKEGDVTVLFSVEVDKVIDAILEADAK